MKKEIALKWIQNRITFIAENCDLKIEHNKEAYDVLNYVKEILNKEEK